MLVTRILTVEEVKYKHATATGDYKPRGAGLEIQTAALSSCSAQCRTNEPSSPEHTIPVAWVYKHHSPPRETGSLVKQPTPDPEQKITRVRMGHSVVPEIK